MGKQFDGADTIGTNFDIKPQIGICIWCLSEPASQIFNNRIIKRAPPDKGPQFIQKGLSGRHITRNRSGPDKGSALPGAGLTFIIAERGAGLD